MRESAQKSFFVLNVIPRWMQGTVMVKVQMAVGSYACYRWLTDQNSLYRNVRRNGVEYSYERYRALTGLIGGKYWLL